MNYRRLWQRGVLFVCVAGLLLGSASVQTAQGQTDGRCFSETGQCIAGRIRTFWEQNGGLAVFGLPISALHEEAVDGMPHQVQWFQRNRLELHSENAPPYDVLIGRVGADRLQQQGRDWQDFPRSEPQNGCRFFSETGHNVCGAMLALWRTVGLELDGQAGKSESERLALWGLPLSDLQTETLSDGKQYEVQWFERARVELHPENRPPADVLLGLLGNELTGITVVAPPPMPAPTAAPTTAPAHSSAFATGPCPFRVPGGLSVTCGKLTVPEDRRQGGGRNIHLAVAIVRARVAKPAPDPVLYLSGGPGSAALPSTTLFAQAWSPFLANRDFVVVDQRGTGFSSPALDCPEVEQLGDDLLAEHVTREGKVQAEASALIRCHDQFVQAGVNLAAYTSADSAADLEDLRLALGYGRWNVFGISYGTRLALTLMRDHPAGVRSVILDSTYPPQVNLYTEMPANTNRVFTTLFAGCAASASCNAAYPAIETTFYDLVSRLDANPVTLQVRNSRTGSNVDLVVDGSELIGQVYRMLYISAQIPSLPKMIADASVGNYDLLANMESVRLGREGHFSHGMYFSVQCSEEMPFASREEVARTAAAYPRLQTYFRGILENTPTSFSLCNSWGVRQPDPIENQPVHSAIPTLLLSGAYDPITPPAWAKLTASTLSTSYLYSFPASGHAVIASGACPAGIIASFLRAPSSAPDASCVAGLRGPQFR